MISSFSLSSRANLFGIHKHNSKCSPCQHYPFVDPQVDSVISSDPVKFFSEMSEGYRKLFNSLLYWCNQQKQIYIRQDTLARFAGYVCRETANRIIARFVKLGLISKLYRHKTSCLYKVSSFFHDIKVRSKLKRFLSQLGYLPMWLLSVDVTQYISINLLTNNTTTNNMVNLRDAHVRACGLSVVKEVEVKMKQEIASYVDEIPYPLLSYEQKVELSSYSKKEVEYALKQMKDKNNVVSHASFLLGVCRNQRKNKQQSSEFVEKKEPVYRTFTKEDQDARRLKKLIYAAEVRGESGEYIDSLLSDFRPIVQIENSEWERVKFLANQKLESENKPRSFNLGTVCSVRDKSSHTQEGQPVTNSHTLRYTGPISSMPQHNNTQRSIGELIKEQFRID